MKTMPRFKIPLCLAMVLLVAAPQSAQSARRRSRAKSKAAVIVTVSAKQARSKEDALASLVRKELRKNGIQVSPKPIPRRVVKRKRRLVSYARARRIKRIYALSVGSRGENLVLALADKRAPRMRNAYFAKLSINDTGELDNAVPSLVKAVIRREKPKPVMAQAPKASIPKTGVQEKKAPDTRVQDTTVQVAAFSEISNEEEQGDVQGTVRKKPAAAGSSATGSPREILYGFSLEPGIFLRSPVSMFGGSAKIYYQKRPYRYGLELSGMGGDGSLVSIAARAQYLFRPAWKMIPVVGAGLGYLFLSKGKETEGNGGAFSASVGAQFDELLSWTRMVVEAEVVLPMFSLSRFDFESDNGIIEPVTRSSWDPAVVLKVSCLF